MSDRSKEGRARFGERLKRLRRARGFSSQWSLASAVGIGTIAVNRHETGRACPSAKVMLVYADALRVNPCYLEHGVGDVDVPDAVYAYLASPNGRRCTRDLALRLRLMQWETVFPRPPSVADVHEVVRIIMLMP